MKYRVVKYFTDLQDNNYAYHAGDEFPRDGLEVSEERLAELASDKNRRGFPMIEPVKEEQEAEPIVEEKPKKSARGKKEKVNSDAE